MLTTIPNGTRFNETTNAVRNGFFVNAYAYEKSVNSTGHSPTCPDAAAVLELSDTDSTLMIGNRHSNAATMRKPRFKASKSAEPWRVIPLPFEPGGVRLFVSMSCFDSISEYPIVKELAGQPVPGADESH